MSTNGHLLSKIQTLSYMQLGAPASIWLVCMQQAAKVRQDRPQAIVMPCRGAARGRGRGSASSLIHMLCSQPAAGCMHWLQHSGMQYSSAWQVGLHAVQPLMPGMFCKQNKTQQCVSLCVHTEQEATLWQVRQSPALTRLHLHHAWYEHDCSLTFFVRQKDQELTMSVEQCLRPHHQESSQL